MDKRSASTVFRTTAAIVPHASAADALALIRPTGCGYSVVHAAAVFRIHP
ncbi:MAG: hypothetical protein WBN82_06480 [Porticoccaceae bacterium]